jgi:hypothetical protein
MYRPIKAKLMSCLKSTEMTSMEKNNRGLGEEHIRRLKHELASALLTLPEKLVHNDTSLNVASEASQKLSVTTTARQLMVNALTFFN